MTSSRVFGTSPLHRWTKGTYVCQVDLPRVKFRAHDGRDVSAWGWEMPDSIAKWSNVGKLLFVAKENDRPDRTGLVGFGGASTTVRPPFIHYSFAGD